ncbi:hypothetical protein H2200_001151 [Cladophialophora chaetospira]|uniref:Xylanolytic transcriptional activator regulatory domain-containing protein n=1 Tax=Cladophialophora chaetospira TaxID=386627 RepID=A0AA38XKC2_9EURO|nr:hypothetical protein H2200_001151 [Cladophialophora chaetospira]
MPELHTACPSQLAAPNVKDRVKQLESQVDFLMDALKQANPNATVQDTVSLPTQSPPDNVFNANTKGQPVIGADSAGYIEFSLNQTSYVGGSHWLAILRNIPELAEFYLSNPSGVHLNLLAQTDEEDPDLTGWPERASRQELLNAIPPKEFADSLIAVCFANTNNEAMIVHPPTFRKEYDQFWADPTSTPIMWVGLLYALMCLAVQYQRFSPDEARRLQVMDSDPEKLIKRYHVKTIQCLIAGKYTRGPPYSVETLMLYLFIESLRGQDIKNLDGPWIQWGSLVRIALKAGYHRDGSHFPEISCFQAETRRRVWTILVGWDLYLSIQFALPRVINHSLCDTKEPRNLYDDDLYEHMVELPPPRPETAQTFPQFHVGKNILLEIFGKINDLTMCVAVPPAYSEVLRLDSLLTHSYNSIISVWQPRPAPPESGTVSQSRATVSVNCTFLAFIYHRAQVVLHRKYLTVGRTHRQYAYSRKVAIEAALTILQHQWVLYLETQVGGQLCRHGWKFLVLLVQDFLFATAVLCAELAEEILLSNAHSSSEGSAATANGETAGSETRNRVFHALSSAYIVWLQSNDSESSREIKVLVGSLKHLLNKAQEVGFGQAKMLAPTPPVPHMSAASTVSNTGGSESTPSEQRPPGDASGTATPQTDGIYWGLGHFPI